MCLRPQRSPESRISPIGHVRRDSVHRSPSLSGVWTCRRSFSTWQKRSISARLARVWPARAIGWIQLVSLGMPAPSHPLRPDWCPRDCRRSSRPLLTRGWHPVVGLEFVKSLDEWENIFRRMRAVPKRPVNGKMFPSAWNSFSTTIHCKVFSIR